MGALFCRIRCRPQCKTREPKAKAAQHVTSVFPFCPCDDLHSCNAMSGHFLAYHMIIRVLPEGKFVCW
jgi:hypothetical protein